MRIAPLRDPLLKVPAVSSALSKRVDGSSLAVLRMAMSGLLLYEVWSFFSHGWIDRYWIEPQFHFTYFGFDWVRPWPGNGMYIHFVVIGAAAVAVGLGLHYRFFAVLLFVAFMYQFLLEQARYLNHFYAASLVLLLLAVVPAHAAWSVDAAKPGGRIANEHGMVPLWALLVLRAQVGVIYIYAGVAKLSPDWLQGRPWRLWLEARSTVPFVSALVDSGLDRWVFAYGSLALDLLIVPALLWRRTRALAFVLAVLFHYVNSQLFRIGIFPWMMIAATTLFFAPHWPRACLGHLCEPETGRLRLRESSPALRSAGVALLTAYLVIQVLLPLRHLLYPGEVAWSEEGHRFAWRMMLRQKRGSAEFRVVTREGSRYVMPNEYLEPWQTRVMVSRPDMILQFAHYLARRHGEADSATVQVYVDAQLSLNGRRHGPLIDPTVDLVAQQRTLRPSHWILPAPAR